jgi:uncharacterized protein with HEPN domain
MKRETAKSLHDAGTACAKVERYTADSALRSQLDGDALQLIIERRLMIIGESLYRARQIEEEIFSQIPDAPKIISLRNRIVHGYDTLNHDLLWEIAVTEMPELDQTLTKLLDAYQGEAKRLQAE